MNEHWRDGTYRLSGSLDLGCEARSRVAGSLGIQHYEGEMSCALSAVHRERERSRTWRWRTLREQPAAEGLVKVEGVAWRHSRSKVAHAILPSDGDPVLGTALLLEWAHDDEDVCVTRQPRSIINKANAVREWNAAAVRLKCEVMVHGSNGKPDSLKMINTISLPRCRLRESCCSFCSSNGSSADTWNMISMLP